MSEHDAMIFIEDEVAQQLVAAQQPLDRLVVQATAPAQVRLTHRVSVHQGDRAAYLAKPDTDWVWEDLRDYVAAQITARSGLFPRDAVKEKAIFSSFCTRWPTQAVAIARYAFEVEHGRWMGAPISMNRFCRASDPHFARKIDEHLRANTVS